MNTEKTRVVIPGVLLEQAKTFLNQWKQDLMDLLTRVRDGTATV